MSESSALVPLLAALRSLLRWLAETEVPGLVIGGVAASLLGRPRMTRDVDAVVWLDISNLDDFVAAASEHGLVPRVSDAAEFARTARVLLLTHTESTIDVDVALGGLPFEKQAIEQAQRATLAGLSIPVPRTEDLVIMKAVAHRPRDVADVEAVLEAHPDVDRERVRQVVREFAEAAEMPELLSDLEAILARVPPVRP